MNAVAIEKLEDLARQQNNSKHALVCAEQKKQAEKMNEDFEREASHKSLKDQTLIEAEKSFSLVAEFDALLFEIQNLLGGKTSHDASRAVTEFTPFKLTDEDISHAKTIFKECTNTKIGSIFHSGREPEFKNALFIMLIANAFSHRAAHEVAKFLADFDQTRSLYLAARRDLREAERKESLVYALQASLEPFFQEFAPIRDQVNEVNREAAERNAKKALLRDGLQELAACATAARQELIDAEQDMRLFMDKKERAEDVIGETESLWESLKKECVC